MANELDLFSFLRRKNMCQADLSKALDTTPGNVNRWAKGDGVPSYDLCKKLLEQGMTVKELFGIDIPNLPPSTDPAFLEGVANASDPEFNAKVEKIVLEMKAKGQL